MRLKAATLNRCQLYYIIKLRELIFSIKVLKYICSVIFFRTIILSFHPVCMYVCMYVFVYVDIKFPSAIFFHNDEYNKFLVCVFNCFYVCISAYVHVYMGIHKCVCPCMWIENCPAPFFQ